MNTLSTINLMPSNKKELETFFNKIKAEVLSGENDVLLFLKQIKLLESLIKNILEDKDIKDEIISEAFKHLQGTSKSFKYKEVNFTLKDSGKYDYSNCGHSEYDEIVNKIETLKEKKKEIEKFLKTIPELEPIVNADTGEIYQRPIKNGSDSIQVKL